MTNFEWVAAFVFAVGATARITRLVTWDKWPPAVKARILWDRITKDGPWSFLFHCGYCFSVWAAGLVVGSAALSIELTGEVHPVWWWVNGGLTVAYLGAILMARDGDDDE